MTFYDGSSVLGAATLVERNGGVAHKLLAAGQPLLAGVLRRRHELPASTSATVTQVVAVRAISTTTTLATTPNPVRVWRGRHADGHRYSAGGIRHGQFLRRHDKAGYGYLVIGGTAALQTGLLAAGAGPR